MNIQKLLNRLTVSHYVNLHGDGNTLNSDNIDNTIKGIFDRQSKSYCIAVNITNINEEDEKIKAKRLKNKINKEMHKKGYPHWIHEASSIDSLLHKFNKQLEDPALIIFYPFTSPQNGTEKDWLRSIRSFIHKRESLFVRLLLISSERLDKWDLRPCTDFDERAVEFFPYE